MSKNIEKKAINGTWGKLFLDNEPVLNVKSFELKQTSEFEEIFVCGSLTPFYKLTKITNEGNLTIINFDSKLQRKIAEANSSGKPLYFKANVEINDPDNPEVTRIIAEDILFPEVTFKFETNAIGEVELAFKCAGDIRFK